MIAAKYFGWWFAWGIFSAIMAFIVIKGGNLAFQEQVAAIFGIGIVAGLAGLLYYFKRSRHCTS